MEITRNVSAPDAIRTHGTRFRNEVLRSGPLGLLRFLSASLPLRARFPGFLVMCW